MKLNQLGIFSYVFFLLNAVRFNMVEGEGGGASEQEPQNEQRKEEENAKKWADPMEGNSANQEPQDSGSQEGGDAGKVEDLPEWAQKHIKDLRGESANNRTKVKDLEGRFGNLEAGMKSALGISDEEEISPEDQISQLQTHGESLSMQNAVLNVALENGLDRDQAEYFQFLLQKEGESMEDDQELTEERYEELIAKSRGTGGNGQKTANTSVDNGGKPAAGGESGQLTVEQFSKMSYTEKVQLRAKNPNSYNKLFSEARSKGII